MSGKQGRTTIPPDVNVWPHEFETARAIAQAGKPVEFVRRSEEKRAHSADCVIEGTVWEMKSPKASKLSAIERDVRRACSQSKNVIIDVRRMKGIPAHALEREVFACSRRISKLSQNRAKKREHILALGFLTI